jgi:hypothetical protein
MIHEGGKEKNTNVWGRLRFIIISGETHINTIILLFPHTAFPGFYGIVSVSNTDP